jgi:hypothetical protein
LGIWHWEEGQTGHWAFGIGKKAKQVIGHLALSIWHLGVKIGKEND